jgi:hypothetical protein
VNEAQFKIKGHLVYLGHLEGESHFADMIEGNNTGGWLPDTGTLLPSMPDWMPLWNTIKDHWKMVTVIIGAIAVIASLCYVFGPTVALAILKFVLKIVIAILRFIATCIVEMFRFCRQVARSETN